jgi:hypothetical protein
VSSEVFRFAIVRPPIEPVPQDVDAPILLRARNSDFIRGLQRARKREDRSAMLELANAYVESDGYVSSPRRLPRQISLLLDSIRELDDANFADEFERKVQNIFDSDARSLIDSAEYQDVRLRISESIVAHAIASASDASVGFLTDVAQLLNLVEDHASGKPVRKPRRYRATLLLPDDVLPLPPMHSRMDTQREEDAAALKTARSERLAESLRVSEELKLHSAAIAELMHTLEIGHITRADGAGKTSRAARASARDTGGLLLPKADTDNLSASTKKALRSAGIATGDLDVAQAVASLDGYASRLAERLYGGTRGSRLARIGGHFVPEDILGDPVFEVGEALVKIPGNCLPATIDSSDDAAQTPVPVSEFHGVRILGIADLLMVEQDLLRYQLGEIAHIENVLPTERRDRRHRTTRTREESVLVESEDTETNQRDLASSDRFELQSESQKVINETTSLSAGITVNASYGVVDTTANFNAASTDSLMNSQRSAATYARDITSRAVSSIEARRLERRFQRTVEEVEEINRHTFNNQMPGATEIVGMYRFVDKIYIAQIVNYGKRLMLEFIVPEPAAFLRHAMLHRPVEDIAVTSPSPPGYCVQGAFVPLHASDLDRYNYLHWASQYGVTDIEPPPPHTLVVSSAITSSLKEMETVEEDDESREYFNTKSISIDIPDGYTPVTADVVIDAMLDYEDATGDTATIHVLIDNKTLATGGLNKVVFTPGVWKNVALAANTFNKALYAAVINIYCRLGVEQEQQWKLKTYNAIMSAYADRKSQYDQALERARVQSSFQQVRGSNPFLNRETEKIELKKGCVALLTGQRFDSFDAVAANTAPHGYPEIDFEESMSEGRFVSFFEQSMEWSNMTYVFYPYFWGRKSEWLVTAQLGDDDPLYTRFLQAGAARVNVPVRPGFEGSIMTYLSSEVIWAGEGELIAPGSSGSPALELALIDELRSELNDNYVEGDGRLDVVQGVARIVGIGTEFTAADERRRIRVGGATHVIDRVASSEEIFVAAPYPAASATGSRYSLGGKLVGEPWEVKLPTSLVKLDSGLPVT